MTIPLPPYVPLTSGILAVGHPVILGTERAFGAILTRREHIRILTARVNGKVTTCNVYNRGKASVPTYFTLRSVATYRTLRLAYARAHRRL